MILAVSLNPSVDRTVFVEGLRVCDTNRVVRTETDAGGKAVNLARVAVELGATTLLLGFVAGGTGAFVRHVLQREHVPHELIELPGETRLNICIEDLGGGPPTMLNARGAEVPRQDWELLKSAVQRHAAPDTWVALGGSVPPGVPNECFRELALIAKSKGAGVVLDADGEPFLLGMEAKPDFIKPNVAEAQRYVGRELDSQERIVQAAQDLYDKGTPIVVISRGDQGAIMVCEHGVFNAVPPKIKATSTIGSGDSLIAGMLSSMERGEPIDVALRWGVAAGAATAMSDGASIGRLNQTQQIFENVTVSRVGIGNGRIA